VDHERWRRAEELFHAALERGPEARPVFLDVACGEDTDLRRQVELLLAKNEEAGSFLETPAMRDTTVSEALLGRQFGPYRIVSPLGAGGMGEVYRAHDSKLGRDVAIKTLPAEFAQDPERLARLRREARTVASLNHPNIAAIYGLEESGDVECLVLELVEGETLRGPLPIERALDYARQVAEALEAAHDNGIIHRDLKPANVKVTPQGRVKVLDFGLAKAIWGLDQNQDLSQTANLTGMSTLAGHIVGTPGYMSPEQARGREVDKRTDIWAFGCLLYELLSGKRAFQGDCNQDTIAAVLEREPDLQTLPARTPAKIRGLLRRCLQKDADRRLQSIADARRTIEEVQRGSKRWQVIAAAAAVTILVIGPALWMRGPDRPPDRSQWIQLTNFPGSVSGPALSPDGRTLAFVRGPEPRQIYVKMLPDGQPVQLTHDSFDKGSLAFHWDTWAVPVFGGEPKLLLKNASGLVWTGPRQVLFSDKTGLHMGIVAAEESRIGQRDIYLPAHEHAMAHKSQLSPDRKWVLLVEMDQDHQWLPCRMVPFDGRSSGRPVGPPRAGCTSGAWSPDGKWMYVSSDAGGAHHIWRQRFPDGRPEQVTSGPTEEKSIAMAPDGRSFVTAVALSNVGIWVHDASSDQLISMDGNSVDPKFTRDGRRLYYRVVKKTPTAARYMGGEGGEVWATDLKSGRSECLVRGFRSVDYDVSADGREIVMEVAGPDRRPQLWIADSDRRSDPRRIPHVEGRTPRFGPGGEIFFRTSGFTYRVRPDGNGLRKAIEQQTHLLWGVSPDGQWVVAWSPTPAGGIAVQAFPVSGGPPVLIAGTLNGWHFSPDGRFISVCGGPVGEGRSYVIPVPPGQALPNIPAAGFRSEQELASVPGARRIDAQDIVAGPSPDVYAFYRSTGQQNLYRIPIP
jgi:serine/threonine protein kinase